MPETTSETLLLTGATGFVGSHMLPALRAAGYRVRCASRNPERAQARDPEGEWVEFDLERPETIGPALSGCRAALFLVHSMGAGHHDYPERERRAALRFREAVEAEGLRRVVYLGGVAPNGPPSRHLKSRLDTGEVLRSGQVSVIELRAAMIIGLGSESWLMVRDLAKRLPAMLLPRWLKNHSWPVHVDDVVAATLVALSLPGTESGWYDVPGAERVSHRELMRRVAVQMGKNPTLINVPVLSPRLSSYWIGLVTRADFALARELVEGLRYDLDPSGPLIWEAAPEHSLVPLDEAIAQALGDEEAEGELPTPAHRARLTQLGERAAAPSDE